MAEGEQMITFSLVLAGAVVGFVAGYFIGADQQIRGYNEIMAIARGLPEDEG